jgi:hypothetical protein
MTATLYHSSEETCPVAALLPELAENIALQRQIRALGDAEGEGLSDVLSTLRDRQRAIESFAETGRATSLKGAALQLVLLHNAAADMGSGLSSDLRHLDRDAGQLNR